MPASFRLWGLAALVAGAAAGAAGGTCSQARTEAAAPRPSRPPCAAHDHHLDVAATPLAVRLEPRMRAVPPEITCAVMGDAGGGAILRCVATRHGGR